MSEKHEETVAEIKQEASNVGDTDISMPEKLQLTLVARQRQILRNSAVLAQVNQKLARRRGSSDEAKKLGKELDNYVKDITELDKDYPQVKNKMNELDYQALKNEVD